MVLNLRVLYNAEKFLSSCATGGFSRRAQLCQFSLSRLLPGDRDRIQSPKRCFNKHRTLNNVQKAIHCISMPSSQTSGSCPLIGVPHPVLVFRTLRRRGGSGLLWVAVFMICPVFRMWVWVGFLGALIAESIRTFLCKSSGTASYQMISQSDQKSSGQEHSSQILTVVLRIVIWCSLVGGQHFGGTRCPHLQGQSECGKVWSVYGHPVKKMVTLNSLLRWWLWNTEV
jgi:hypothetical protein